MKSRYLDAEAAAAVARWGAEVGQDVALRTYTSRLLGADPTLVLHGGGNTSVKTTAREITGAPVEVLAVKGSGWDLATIDPVGFPRCRLEPLRELAGLKELSDESMVAGLRSQMLDPSSPTPSVEALLHALIPAKFVDHTHANAVLALVDQPDSERRVRDVWGDDVVFVPYVMPGFVLAKEIHGRLAALAGATVMILDKHGIFTWGETARDSYERMIAAVDLAEREVARARAAAPPPPTRLDRAARRKERQATLAPVVRGALARAAEGRPFVLEWRDDDDVLELLAHPEAAALTTVGPITPDHVLRTKAFPAWLGDAASSAEAAEIRAAVEAAIAEFGRAYRAYFERGVAARGRTLRRLDALPRLLAVPGVGVLAVGKTRADARVAGDVWVHTARVILDASNLGTYRPVTELDLFDVEYWSLEQAKLGKGGGALPFAGLVALVTGAAGGIGRATAERFLDLGAHVMLTDLAGDALATTGRELRDRFGLAVDSHPADVTSSESVSEAFAATLRSFGGLDVVVSNAGSAPSGLLHSAEGDAALRSSLELNLLAHQVVAREATRALLAQGIGGCLLFNASKSAFAPGPEFGPYAVPKAALVALVRQYAIDLAPHGIRANAVNADRVRTGLFGKGVLEARARARGVSPDEYFRSNLLRRETTARDVADAFAYLATASATTGAVLGVDGGNPAAFPR